MRERLATLVVAAVMLGATGVPAALANGSETLGPTPAAAGTGIATGGVGTIFGQPGTMTVNIGGTPKQAFLYWAGHTTGFGGDNTVIVSVNGGPSQLVTGATIGGPTKFFDFPFTTPGGTYYSSYRADITSLGGLHSGSNTIVVSGLDFFTCGCYGNPPGSESGNDGAGVLVVYDDGTSPAATIGVRDGLDLAFQSFAPPLDTTVPQTFTYPASTSARTATLVNMVASVESTAPNTPRPTVLRVSLDGGPAIDFIDEFRSVNGEQWDSVARSITIPAGSTSMTVQVLSLNEDGSANLPASLGWITSALSVPGVPTTPGGQPLTIGYWKNWSSCGSSNGRQAPVLDQVLAATGGIALGGSLTVKTCAAAVAILDKSTIDTGKKSASDPAFNMAAQLLAAKLNIAHGATTCPAAQTAVTDGSNLLGSVGFTGLSTWTNTMTAAQAASANAIASTLDAYNNGTLC